MLHAGDGSIRRNSMKSGKQISAKAYTSFMAVTKLTFVALLLAVLALTALGACKKAPESAGGTEDKPAAPSTAGAVISSKEALGFNVRIGEAFNATRLCEKLAKSRVKVDVAAQDATDMMVPGTVGDGTIYFWVLPDPRTPKVVGSLTIGVDINTALQIGKISRAEFERIIKEARAEGEKRGGDAPKIAKYSAAEAMLAAQRNQGVVTDAGVGIGSTKQLVIDAYGEAKDTLFISGDTIRIYRGPKVAVAFRFSDDVVRQVIVFPADYDYEKFNEDTQAMLKPPTASPPPK